MGRKSKPAPAGRSPGLLRRILRQDPYFRHPRELRRSAEPQLQGIFHECLFIFPFALWFGADDASPRYRASQWSRLSARIIAT